MKKSIVSLGLLTFLLSPTVFADSKAILATLQKLNIPTQDAQIYATSFPNVSISLTNRGIFYVSRDGRFISQGPIYDISTGMPQTVGRTAIKEIVDKIKKIAITYKATNEIGQISVFTDVSCMFCQKFHQNINEYNKLGITINYLPYPREGLNSTIAKEMETIWTSSNKKAQLDKGFKGESIPGAANTSVIAPSFTVGQKIGITGTPTLVLSNGEILAGFIPPEKLKEIVNTIH